MISKAFKLQNLLYYNQKQDAFSFLQYSNIVNNKSQKKKEEENFSYD